MVSFQASSALATTPTPTLAVGPGEPCFYFPERAARFFDLSTPQFRKCLGREKVLERCQEEFIPVLRAQLELLKQPDCRSVNGDAGQSIFDGTHVQTMYPPGLTVCHERGPAAYGCNE
jgi:hypothetical protein